MYHTDNIDDEYFNSWTEIFEATIYGGRIPKASVLIDTEKVYYPRTTRSWNKKIFEGSPCKVIHRNKKIAFVTFAEDKGIIPMSEVIFHLYLVEDLVVFDMRNEQVLFEAELE